MSGKRRGLGRSLDVLLSDVSNPEKISPENEEYRLLPVEKIQRGQYQPRRDFDPVALEELSKSIKEQGLIQPVVVRQITGGNYELIAGERRWRAVQMAGLKEIPSLIKNVSDSVAIVMALIENIQRENLNPIEEAYALQRLIEEFDMTHMQAAESVGKSRTTVTNMLRLLNLQSDVKLLLERGDIEMGHARALLALEFEQQIKMAKEVVDKGLSVRETEKMIREFQAGSVNKKTKSKNNMDPDVLKLEGRLSEVLGTAVNVQHTPKGKGKVVIHYHSLDELDGIIGHIT